MFPWTDGFRWTLNHVIFLSLFFCVVSTIAATVVSAIRRSARDLQAQPAAEIGWKSEFATLPRSERCCRHELAGRVSSRTCPNAFDCRHCGEYSQFAALPASVTVDNLGIPYSNDRFYHRGHTWVEPQPDGTLAIGLDELADKLIGVPDTIAMPEVGSELALNETAWSMKKNGKKVRVRMPVEGKVVAIGSPNDQWYVKVRPQLDANDPATLMHLLRGPEVHGWLNRELERLQLQLRTPNTQPSLADGGVLVHGLMDAVPDADWDTVLADTFLEG